MNSMKSLILVGMVSLLHVGCGDWSKEPSANYDFQKLDEIARTEMEQERLDAASGNRGPRVITKTEIETRYETVVREESTIDEKFLVITPDPKMTFNEGQEASFKVRARVLVPGAKVQIKAEGLPQGATLVESTTEAGLYTLRWTPALYTLQANESMKMFDVKLTAQVTQVADPKIAEQLKGLARSKEISLFLFRTQEAPKDLQIENLSNEIEQGQQVPFSVTVTVPGIDQQAVVKPRLVVSYDGISVTNGNTFLEQDGSRHVVIDPKKKDAEYLGNSQWKFNLIYDTKNISVQPQLAKDGSTMTDANGTRVRLSFKVYSPYGLATAEVLKQLKVRYTSQAVETPSSEAQTTDKETK